MSYASAMNFTNVSLKEKTFARMNDTSVVHNSHPLLGDRNMIPRPNSTALSRGSEKPIVPFQELETIG
jgi:hypothetical protein